MFTKMMMLLTALPLTLALCSDANAAVSDAAKARKPLCTELADIKDKNDPRYVLKGFCDKTTFHCTTHARGGIGILGRTKGVCDDPRICTNEVIHQACQEQCVDLRSDKFGIKDAKALKIQATLEKCPINIKTGINTPLTRTTSEPSLPTTEAPVTRSRSNSVFNPSTLPPKEVAPPPYSPSMDDLPPPPSMDMDTTVSPSMDMDTTASPSMDNIPPPLSMDDVSPSMEVPPPPSDLPPPPSMNVPPPPMNVPTPSRTSGSSTPPTLSESQDLLSQIRSGTKLNKSSDRVLAEKPVKEDTSIQSALQKKMEELRPSFAPDQDDEDDEDWN